MNYFKYYAIIIFSLMPYVVNVTPYFSDKNTPPFSIIAYYVPEEHYNPENLPLDKLTHIIFSFTKVIDNEMKFQNKDYGKKLKKLVAQRKNHPNLKVMVACGGWGSKGFSDMAYTPASRHKFVNSVVQFNKTYQLDGIDIDWEYPTIPAAGTKGRPEDKQNFTLLMKELREALNSLKRNQTLTFASAGWERYYDNVEINEVLKYADYMNVMTYDQTSGSSPFTGHHTPLGWIKNDDLKQSPEYSVIETRKNELAQLGYDYELRSANKIINYCKNLGVKPEQIIIGAAFYGRAWQGVPPKNNGLYQPNKGPYIGWSAYSQIRKEFETNNNYKRYWDSIASAPYLYSAKDSIFISYDDTVSVRLKTNYALKNKLGGIMFWQLGNDTKEKNNLLDAIYKESTKY
ncbi:glycoside hydrolase family 18 protein [Yeosuana marina]|uniref:glycoside hydrolase family 18 protein n=1 Tax=Yeosuana marina TaxID=1565536 RepID=UPI0030C8AD0D